MFVDKPDRYVAMMYDGDKLIGQAFYLRRKSPWHSDRYVSFVLQLVLDGAYRGKRYGLKILQAIFGLSNDDAWGICSSNPLTIRALEDATFRHVKVDAVKRNLDRDFKQVLADVYDNLSWLDSFHNGCVNTRFPVVHDENERKIKKAYPDRDFPFPEQLGPGEEWLAVVFRKQRTHVRPEIMKSLTETSWAVLTDAYSRMSMPRQKWASHASDEIAYLFEKGYVRAGDRVLDLGCGVGRHTVELARRGGSVRGVDLSAKLLNIARSRVEPDLDVSFEEADVRSFRCSEKVDVVLCVYDVIGSSIDDEDIRKVVKTISTCLRHGGRAIVSVMNLELSEKLARTSANRFSDIMNREDFDKLMKLPPSQTMQNTGDVFKGQLMLLNPATGVVYRREQFLGENELPAEYVVPDRRFRREDLRRMFASFREISVSCVSAGRWERALRPDEKHAKEILGVFEKRKMWGLF